MKSKLEFILGENQIELDMTYDYLVKYIFFQDTKESLYLSQDILEVMLEHDTIQEIELLHERFIDATSIVQQRIVDCAYRVNAKDYVIMEMQRYYAPQAEERFVMYLSGLVEYRSRKNELYKGKNIALIFMREPFPKVRRNKNSPYMYFRTDQGKDFTDILSLKLIPLYGLKPLFEKSVNELTRKEKYCLWLRYRHVEQYQKQMQAIIESEEKLQMAEQMIENIQNDPVSLSEILGRIRRQCDEQEAILLKEEMEKQKVELQKRQAELKKRQAELQKQKLEAQKLDTELQKQKFEAQKQKSELQKQKLETQKQKQETQRKEHKIQQLEKIMQLVKDGMSWEEAESTVFHNVEKEIG